MGIHSRARPTIPSLLVYRNIVFSNESHFWLNGYVNKQNCRFWSWRSARRIVKSTNAYIKSHSLVRFMDWCHHWTVLVHGTWDDIQRFFAHNARTWLAWHMVSTRRSHTARVTMDLLRGEFGEHFISYSGPVNWPPRSCDLTPLDYFLSGYVKAHVYTDKPASID